MDRTQHFFHGSAEAFEPGQMLDAGSHGQSYPDKSYRPGVYMTTSATRATKWAADVAKNRGAKVGHVYEVEPVGAVSSNRLPWGEGVEHIAEQARVKAHVSATEVLNPGYEDTGFGAAPAQRGKTFRGARLKAFMGGTDPEPKRKAPTQIKGQSALFAASKVVDNAPEANRRLHERDMRVGEHQPSIWDERNAAEAEEASTREARNRARSDEMREKVRKVREISAQHADEIDAIRRPYRAYSRT